MSKKAGLNGQFGWNIKKKNSSLDNMFLIAVLKLQDNSLWNQMELCAGAGHGGGETGWNTVFVVFSFYEESY